jgi:hypothetical protein
MRGTDMQSTTRVLLVLVIVGLSLMEIACTAVVGVGVAVPYGAPGYHPYGPYGGGGVVIAGGPVVRY